MIVNLSADPPICRLENYGQLMVKKKERAKEIRVNAKARSLKEMFIGGGIDKHDLGIKMKKVIEFLSAGHPVRIFVTAKKLRLKIEPFCVEETTMKVLEAVEDHVQSVQQPESATSSRKDFTLNPKIKKDDSQTKEKKSKMSESDNNSKKEKVSKMNHDESMSEKNARKAKSMDEEDDRNIGNENENEDYNDIDNENEESISSQLNRMEAEEEEEDEEEEEEDDDDKKRKRS